MPRLEKTLSTIVKPWGRYIILEKSKDHWIKKLFIKKGSRLSLQSHKFRSEIWIVISGEIEATQNLQITKLKTGDIVKIDRGVKHCIASLTDSWILETAFGHVLEKDIVRYQDDYGRIS